MSDERLDRRGPGRDAGTLRRLAVSQLLLGHRHYGDKLSENAENLAELAYEGARRLAVAEGSSIPSDRPDPWVEATPAGSIPKTEAEWQTHRAASQLIVDQRDRAWREAEELKEQLRDLARVHHSMIAPSRLHDPEHQDFTECPALTCQAVARLT